MVKLILILFLSLIMACVSYAQSSVDTLVIAKRKFPLKQVEPFINTDTKLPLPSEFEKLENRRTILYNSKSDSSYVVTHEFEFGGDIILAVDSRQCDSSLVKYMRLDNFIDTIIVKADEFRVLKPFIKSKNDSLFFFSAKVYGLKNGHLTLYEHELRPNGDIFSFWSDTWFSSGSNEDFTKTTFIVEDIYYRKGLTTYYFNGQFIVIVK